MTALAGYDRLECLGVWHPDAVSPGTEVLVSFGNATLVIADLQSRALAHWSLAAVVALTPGRYAPAPDATETLDIADPAMVAALAEVQTAIAASRIRPGRRRRQVLWAGGLVILATLAVWLPGALARQMLVSLPDVRRTEVGAILLGQMQRQTAMSCRGEAGVAAALQLSDRLWPGLDWQIVVLPQGLTATAALPGRIAVLPADLLRAANDPAEIAGHLVAATLTGDPMATLFDDLGLVAAFQIVTRGTLPPGELEPQAASILAAAPSPADIATIAPVLIGAGVAPGPYASATGQDAGPSPGEALPPVLSDADWIALQAICSG